MKKTGVRACNEVYNVVEDKPLANLRRCFHLRGTLILSYFLAGFRGRRL